ncbi:Uncharacterised protein [Mycobacteroides abscessus]|nr:Uncharacterised protein [Mycobacteroides abscessus]
MSSSAVRLPNRSDRSTNTAVVSSRAPLRAEVRTSDPNSCGERAERSSSAGSMPMRRSTQLAVPFSARIAKAKTAENSTMGPEVARDVQTGRASAKFLGTNSPKIIDIDVAMINASASDIALLTAIPVYPNSCDSRRAITGSARYPVTSVVMVMPSWAPDSWKESVLCARLTNRSRLSPVLARASMPLRSSAVKENSAATKRAVPAVRATKASKLSPVSKTVTACWPP